MSNRSHVYHGLLSLDDWDIQCFTIYREIDGFNNQNYCEPFKILTTECDKHLSQEFNYFKTGFACRHIGRRGETLFLWHIGAWDDTLEIFHHALYKYNNTLEFENLGFGEPIISIYDIDLVIQNIQKLHLICKDIKSKKLNLQNIKKKYLETA